MLTKNKVCVLILVIIMGIFNGCGAQKEDATQDDNSIHNQEEELDKSDELSAGNIQVENDFDASISESEEDIKQAEMNRETEAGLREEFLYTEPMLLNPEVNSVQVVWFTEEKGDVNEVFIYEKGNDVPFTRAITADTTKLSRIRGGKTEEDKDNPSIARDVYRHMAVVDNLPVNDGSSDAVGYRVRTDDIKSRMYSLRSLAGEGSAQKILITSDHQNKNMCAANIQKAFETVPDITAVFVDGDMADVPDRAYDWFDSDNGFFKVMQGKASHEIEGVVYNGAPLIQNVPMFTSIGNHEVMGVYSDTKPISEQFNNPTTREYASRLYDRTGTGDKDEFIKNNSFNTITYDEIFGNDVASESNHYYSFPIGDTRVIVLEMARIWRLATIGFPGKYSEIPGMGEDTYGYGEFIFEPISEGSRQLEFLKKELASDDFQNAKYRIVMYHFDDHSLGCNTVPAYTDPVAKGAISPVTGQSMVVYEYPLEADYITKVVEPLMEEYNVDLLINGHSHIWNRFVSDGGMNILQTSNVGNNYEGFLTEKDSRTTGPSAFNKEDQFYPIRDSWNKDDYVLYGDPKGLSPQYPNVEKLPENLPYLASNTVTAFSILDTQRGVIDSFYFDTQKPDSTPVLFDSFSIVKVK